MSRSPGSGKSNGRGNVRPLAAFAHRPVADTAEPVAAEAGRPITEPDRDDTHTMGHD